MANNLPLAKRQILVCVSASIAAYKSVYLIRSLVQLGAQVKVATTPSTSRFVGSPTFSAVASEPAYDDLWDNRGSISHTTLGKQADLVVLVPATASVISKMANGIADDIVTATLLCTPKSTPVVVVPAMHEEMYDNESTQNNITELMSRGIEFLGPIEGDLAGGDAGRGRMVEPDEIVSRIQELLKDVEPKQAVVLQEPMQLESVEMTERSQSPQTSQPVMLITAGGTREPIDPVRVLTNRSSGKMGHAIAHAALLNGYRVILITTSSIENDSAIERIDVETAEQMSEQVMKNLAQADVVVMTAAVADATPVNVAKSKLKREQGIDSIELKPTPDIVAQIVENRSPGTYVVCFGAETEDVIKNGSKKFENKKVDMLIANDITRKDSGFGSDTNKLWVFTRSIRTPIDLETAPKQALAFTIIELIDSDRN